MAGFTKKIAVLALVAAAACSEANPTLSPSLDRFYFPTSLALRHLPGGGTALVVVSSNFDLRYDLAGGGTVIAVDPDAAQDSRPACAAPCAPTDLDCQSRCCPAGANCGIDIGRLGYVVAGSFGGEVDFADEGNCPQLAEGATPVIAPGSGAAKVLVSSRSAGTLYRIDMDAAGALDCGAGCPFQFGSDLFDPYGSTVVCRDFGDRKASVFVSHLRGLNGEAQLSEVDLRTGAWTGHNFTVDPLGPTHSAAYQKLGTYRRLIVTSLYTSYLNTLVRWLDLTAPVVIASETSPVDQVPLAPMDLYGQLQQAEARGIALSSDGERAYVTFEVYDLEQAQLYGRIVILANILAIVDVRPEASGAPTGTVLKILPLGAGASEIRVLPRRPDPANPGQFLPDLVAIAETGDGALEIYDDGIGAVVKTLGIDPATGRPFVGKQPFGMAVEERPAASCLLPGLAAPTCHRIYVGSFTYGWVSAVELDPSFPSRTSVVKRIGAEQPQ
jgi:hypothetical protein